MRSRITLVTLVGSCWLCGCSTSELPVYTSQFKAFDQVVEIRLLSTSEPAAVQLAADLKQDMQVLDHNLTLTHAGALQQVNERLAGDEPFAVPPLLIPLLQRSYQLTALTGGRFNPAIGFLYDAWGFDAAPGECHLPRPPDKQTLERLVAADPQLAALTLNDIVLQNDNPALKLDFRVGAMGYAMDSAVTTVRAQGMRHGVIRIGNNLRILGDRVGQPWRIPLTHPGGASVIGTLPLSGDVSVFTRSETQYNCRYDQRWYHDVIDPHTGYPVATVRAVTVVGTGDALAAEVAATALFVAGPDKWAEVAAQLGIRMAALIDSAGVVHVSPDMAAQLQIVDHEAKVVRAQWPN